MGIVRRLARAGIVYVVIVLAVLTAFVVLYKGDPAPRSADYIVVLSGDYRKTGGLAPETKERVDRAVGLWKSGTAPVVIMSGGTFDWRHPIVADQMREYAIIAGIPQGAILLESNSHSTLQNALFVAGLLDDPANDTVVLITHAYHLPRSWASFRWAGIRNIRLVSADPNRRYPRFAAVWEPIKIPLNLLRAGGASAAAALNVPRSTYLKLLD